MGGAGFGFRAKRGTMRLRGFGFRAKGRSEASWGGGVWLQGYLCGAGGNGVAVEEYSRTSRMVVYGMHILGLDQRPGD